MTKKVISVHPETLLLKAVDLILKNNFNGLPVIDNDNKLVGILTEYDMMIKGTSLHLPTFLRLIGEFDIYQKDRRFIREDIKKIITLKVSDVMSKEPMTLTDQSTINEAIEIFCRHQGVNPLPVIDGNKKLVGIISRFDIIKLMGDSSAALDDKHTERQLDKKINNFLKNFDSQFVFVSRERTHYWFIFSSLFAVVGFIIAFLIMIRMIGQE